MPTKLKLVNQLVEVLPQNDTTTYPRLNFNLLDGTYAVPVFTADPNDGNTAASFNFGNYRFYIPQYLTRIITLAGTTNQTITLTYTEPNRSPAIITSTSVNQTIEVQYGTTWTATVAGAKGYNSGTLSTSSGTITDNTTISVSEATVAALVLTNSNYKMSDIYPDTYQTMTTVPDEIDTSNLTTISEMFKNCRKLTTIPKLNLGKVVNYTNAFENCESLTPTFPWKIDCSAFRLNEQIDVLRNMFKGSSVTKVFIQTNYTQSDFTYNITSQLLKGDNTLDIVANPYIITDDDDYWNNADKSIYSSRFRITGDETQLSSDEISLDVWRQANKVTLGLDISHTMSLARLFSDSYSNTYFVPAIRTNQLDTSHITNMSYMFENCGKLTTITFGNTAKINTNNVTNMSYMFSDCSSLATIPNLGLDTCSVNDPNRSYMFRNCTSLPATFPYVIDCSTYTVGWKFSGSGQGLYHIFEGSSVTKVTLKNVPSSLKDRATSQNLKGDSTLTINFV